MNQICKIDHLREMVLEANDRLLRNIPPDHWNGQDQKLSMVEILAPAGYHQNQEIAESLGLEFDENLANEWDWDSFRQEIRHLNSRLVKELQDPSCLPDGPIFSFGFDKDGNFGLLLSSPIVPSTQKAP